uniref:Uncharacterized protein n=1 Tax=Amphimedon queenslandica TaxID=400682 RepID=A0A1X7VNA8_AMPQE
RSELDMLGTVPLCCIGAAPVELSLDLWWWWCIG